ncbi:potassium-transporting ATPase subunit C [Stenotrophomonas humi]|uniref:Potassium-transporting ATPase KdpC subunit n=1 Tax=Stenotrophomonas humi TaxID=405444 RepID=A0A0R0CA53_9GAMM|nr:potassium-transporting ATPase subunit KdpC [Stenotrophomonas humi]KRG62040.1 potassium-transporting ATPase subunit C [Stenotrophomonas humi]
MNRSSTHSTSRAHNPVWRPAIGLALFGLLGTGLMYALAATGLAGTLFPAQADGSLVRDADGTVRASLLVAQPFSGDGYFQARPSAANYDPMAAAGSNMARSNPDLIKRVAEATADTATREKIDPAKVPGELVTQSGSGMDPELSPAAAQVQVARVAAARGWSQQRVQALVDARLQGRQWGVLGQPRINVVALNRALDEATHAP